MMYFFGCGDRIGHYLYREDGHHTSAFRNETPFGTELDGGPYLPEARLDGAGRWRHGVEHQSACKLTHVHGWTLIACFDRTLDSRGASNSTFFCEGTHTFDAMVVMARDAFPKIVERIERAKPLYLAPEAS